MKNSEPQFRKNHSSEKEISFAKSYRSFRKNKLGIFDSFYGALYISLYGKNEKRAENPSFFMRLFTKAPYFFRNIFGFIARFFKSLFYNDGGTKKYKRKRDFLKANYPVIAALLIFIAALAYIIIYTSKPIVLYAEIDGESVAVIPNESIMESAVAELEKNVGAILGTNFSFPYEIKYEFKKEWKAKLTEKNDIITALYPYLRDYITTASGIYIDGTLVAICENGTEVKNMLSSLIAERYAQTKDDTTRFYNDVNVIDQAYPTKSVITIEKAELLLRELMISPAKRVKAESLAAKNTQQEDDVHIKYTVKGLLSDLDFVNKAKKNTSNVPQDTSNIYLRFCTTKEMNYEEDIPFTTIYEESAEHYTSMMDITQYGETGLRQVSATVFYDNGIEISRKINTEIIKKEPVKQIVSIGVKMLPESLGIYGYKNRFILPHIGEVSYKFGNREDGMHYGWDVPGKEGENVYAAASGIIATAIGPDSKESVFQGKSYTGFGYVVVIAHGDEYYTLYAHMSDVCVKVGQEVKQGEKIGEIGNTGASQGNHVHFEINLNNKRLNPENGYMYSGAWTIYDYKEDEEP